MTCSAHGSFDPSRPTNCGANSSWMFGARTARLYEPRNRTSLIGANSSRQLVGVGVVLAAVAQLVAGLAIAHAERQIVDEAVLDDRDLGFAEEFEHLEVAVDRKRRSALAGEVARLERLVRVQLERFLADTRHRSSRRRHLPPTGSSKPISPSVPVKLALRDLLGRDALDDAEHVQIVDRRRPTERRRTDRTGTQVGSLLSSTERQTIASPRPTGRRRRWRRRRRRRARGSGERSRTRSRRPACSWSGHTGSRRRTTRRCRGRRAYRARRGSWCAVGRQIRGPPSALRRSSWKKRLVVGRCRRGSMKSIGAAPGFGLNGAAAASGKVPRKPLIRLSGLPQIVLSRLRSADMTADCRS